MLFPATNTFKDLLGQPIKAEGTKQPMTWGLAAANVILQAKAPGDNPTPELIIARHAIAMRLGGAAGPVEIDLETVASIKTGIGGLYIALIAAPILGWCLEVEKGQPQPEPEALTHKAKSRRA